MKKNQKEFIHLLQQTAKQQSKLSTYSILPKWISPLSNTVALHPWQSLLVISFFSAWAIFIIWFEFLFQIVQNIVTGQ